MSDDSNRSFSRFYKFYRKLRYLNYRGTLFSHKGSGKTKAAKRRERRRLRYRQLRFLINTGRLFRIDRAKLQAYLYSKILFAFSRKNLMVTVNSTSLFLLAYFLVYVSKQFVVAFAASSLNIRTELYYYDVDFLIRSKEWTPDAVKILFSAGPFTTLLLTIISLIIYVKMIEKTSIIRTFILWVFCHSLIQFLGEIMAGTLLSEGFGYVLLYLFFPDTIRMLITIFAVVSLAAAGLFFSRNFLFTGNTYYNYLKGRNQNKFVFSHIVLPFFLGNFIIMIIKIPGMTFLEMMINWSMILLLLPAIVRSRFTTELFFDEAPRKIRLYWSYILAIILIIPVYRIIFGAGVGVGI